MWSKMRNLSEPQTTLLVSLADYHSTRKKLLEFFADDPPFAVILEWIATAKKPETRAKRIAETARLAAQNVRVNQWRQ